MEKRYMHLFYVNYEPVFGYSKRMTGRKIGWQFGDLSDIAPRTGYDNEFVISLSYFGQPDFVWIARLETLKADDPINFTRQQTVLVDLTEEINRAIRDRREFSFKEYLEKLNLLFPDRYIDTIRF